MEQTTVTKNLTPRQQEIYNNLMALCAENELFFFADQTTAMQMKVRIFSYRLGGYGDWVKPDAIECRGIMFEMNGDTPVSLLSRPMEKFFNYAEVKAWQALGNAPAGLGDVVEDVMIKEDGSLISTYMDHGYLFVKSKASVHSDQADNANFLLLENKKLRERLTELVNDGYTVNMEYVAPGNRIVIGYAEPALVILNVRNNDTGEYIPYSELFADGVIRKHLVQREKIDVLDLDAFVKDTYKMEGIEGYVVKTNQGFIKIKTEWYVHLHRTKDSVNSNKDLFLNIANGTSDDLKQLFIEDVVALQKVHAFEDLFIQSLNELLSTAEKSIEELRGKSRKDFAVGLGNKTEPNDKLVFGPLMNWYTSQDKEKMVEDIVGLMCRNYEQFIPELYK